MNLILRQIIGYQQGLKTSPASPLLKKQLEDTQKDLNQILNKWKFGEASPTSAQEFLNNFEPWINKQLASQKELKVFLAKKGLTDLKEADSKLTNRDLSEHEELEQVRKELEEAQQKHEQELAQQEQTFANTEQDYLARIKKLEEDKEAPEDYEDLVSERDEAIREKRTLEQETLALNNQLRNKQQELQNKEQALESLKREKNQLEVNHQKALREKNGLITTLNQEIKQHKEKYSKQGKLLDTEQLECKRLEEENQKLTKENQELTQQNIKMGQRLLELDPPTEVNL